MCYFNNNFRHMRWSISRIDSYPLATNPGLCCQSSALECYVDHTACVLELLSGWLSVTLLVAICFALSHLVQAGKLSYHETTRY